MAFIRAATSAFALVTQTKQSVQDRHYLPSLNSIHQDDEGNCIFGKKSYWDDMYNGDGDRPADKYSWYCGWNELEPFWAMLVPTDAQVLIIGIGNDCCPVEMYDAGWRNLTAFDYSEAGVKRAKQLFGSREGIKLLTADACNVPLFDASFNATLDKGTLDAIYITGKDVFLDAIKELGRLTAENGIVVSISSVVPPEELLSAFDSRLWTNTHDGSLAFAPDGEATIDLGAELYSWRRTGTRNLE